MEPPKRRFFIRRGKRVEGPYAPAQLAAIVRANRETPVCPQNLDPNLAENWGPAAAYAEFRRGHTRSGGPRRFYFDQNGKAKGPVPAQVIALASDGDPAARVCPEGVDVGDARQWKTTADFQEFRSLVRPSAAETEALVAAAAAGKRRAAAGPRLTAAAVLIGVSGYFINLDLRPPAPQFQAPEPALSGGARAGAIIVPACGGTVDDLAGGAPEVVDLGSDLYEVRWEGADDSIILRYDEISGEIAAGSPAAARLLDFRSPCP